MTRISELAVEDFFELQARTSNWSFQLASEVFEELTPRFFAVGWLLSMCGSVVRNGEGRDLDLVATPTWTTAVDHDYLVDALEHRGWTLVERAFDTEHGATQVVFVVDEPDDRERLVDMLLWTERDPVQKRGAELDYEIATEGWGDGV